MRLSAHVINYWGAESLRISARQHGGCTEAETVGACHHWGAESPERERERERAGGESEQVRERERARARASERYIYIYIIS